MLKKVNVKAGEMSYQQRSDLGKLFASMKLTNGIIEPIEEVRLIQEAYLILHGEKLVITATNGAKVKAYLYEIIEGLKYWLNAEEKMLKYEPTDEEKRAKIGELSKNIGIFGTAIAIAERFGVTPFDVLNKWAYCDVFGILYVDIERAKYQKRLADIHQAKYKKLSKSGKRAK